MDFDAIFAAYYTQYRGESEIPPSTDEEYTIGLQLANEAINHWANYEGTYWKELWTTNQLDGTGEQTITTDQATYTMPTLFREIGGIVTVVDSNGATQKRYPLIEAHQKQFRIDEATQAYVTGNPKDGYTLNLNPAPPASLNGLDLDYEFYAKPTTFTTGTDVTEMADPYFIVHHMLGNRYRASRNWSAYQTAKRDSENALKVMQMDNNSGTYANPWKLADNSGASFGA